MEILIGYQVSRFISSLAYGHAGKESDHLLRRTHTRTHTRKYIHAHTLCLNFVLRDVTVISNSRCSYKLFENALKTLKKLR